MEAIASQPGEDVGHREGLTGRDLAVEWHPWHWPIEQRGHLLGDGRPDSRMPRHEARQAGEQDSAYHGRIEVAAAEVRARRGPPGLADGFPIR